MLVKDPLELDSSNAACTSLRIWLTGTWKTSHSWTVLRCGLGDLNFQVSQLAVISRENSFHPTTISQTADFSTISYIYEYEEICRALQSALYFGNFVFSVSTTFKFPICTTKYSINIRCLIVRIACPSNKSILRPCIFCLFVCLFGAMKLFVVTMPRLFSTAYKYKWNLRRIINTGRIEENERKDSDNK